MSCCLLWGVAKFLLFLLAPEADAFAAAAPYTTFPHRNNPSSRGVPVITGFDTAHPGTALRAMSEEEAGAASKLLATALGYLVGAGSLVLYTPIAFRVYRQKSADGLVISTWWLKLASYAISDIYSFTRGYPVSTYIETLTITVEAAVVLILVAHYQRRLFNDAQFLSLTVAFVLACTWGLTVASEEATALGQFVSVVLNSGALVPQFVLNAQTRSKGDYSPLTAGLASTGCAIRLFTTVTLNDSDPVLLGTFGIAFLLNSALFAQILYYGVKVEGLSVLSVFAADLGRKEEEPDEGAVVDDEKVELAALSINE